MARIFQQGLSLEIQEHMVMIVIGLMWKYSTQPNVKNMLLGGGRQIWGAEASNRPDV